MERAGFGRRLPAIILDSLFLIILMGVAMTIYAVIGGTRLGVEAQSALGVDLSWRNLRSQEVWIQYGRRVEEMALDLEKPFHPGDWLVIEGGVRAQVVDMSWRSTHLRTKEGLDIYEPNANLSVSRLINYGSGERPFAVEIRIGLPYGVPPAEVKEVLREAAMSAPGALDRPTVITIAAFGK